MKGCSHRPALCLDDLTMPATKGSSNCHHYREQPDFASASKKKHSLPETRGNKGRFLKGLVRDNDGEFPMILRQFASWWRFLSTHLKNSSSNWIMFQGLGWNFKKSLKPPPRLHTMLQTKPSPWETTPIIRITSTESKQNLKLLQLPTAG